jgi:uncharacterized protein involved in exopolysaccharide biosynthesis
MTEPIGPGRQADDDGMSLAEVAGLLRARWRLLVAGPLLAGLLTLGGTYLVAPTFTAATTIMPPQQQGSTVAMALSALGPLGGLAGNAGGLRSTGDQYVSLLQSATIADRLIDRFKLQAVYDVKFRTDARKELARNVRVSLGKKDGLISVEVDDEDPKRAAEMANQYVEELRRLTSTLAVTEAQQRRVFFEQQLAQNRDRLVKAQQALQESGFNAGALKAEPRAAAEGYARLKAEVTAAEVRLQVARNSLTDAAPEVRQQQSALAALREQLARAEQATQGAGGPDYIGRYREFKYQETLFEMYARQFELARVDESREGALIQVVDAAAPPERKSRPKRALLAGLATLAVALVLAAGVLVAGPGRRAPSPAA